jgi:hypothetical protein
MNYNNLFDGIITIAIPAIATYVVFFIFPEFMHDPADLPVKSCFTESASIAIDTIIKTGL